MNKTALKKMVSILLVFSMFASLVGDAAAAEFNAKLTEIENDDWDSYILSDKINAPFEREDEHFVDYAHNAAFLTSGLSEEVFSKGSMLHGSDNVFSRELASLNEAIEYDGLEQEEAERVRTLICSGYTYRQARAALVSAEMLGLSVSELCEAKEEEILGENEIEKNEIAKAEVNTKKTKALKARAEEGPEELASEYESEAIRLGIPASLAAKKLNKMTKAETSNVLDSFEDRLMSVYEAEASRSNKATGTDLLKGNDTLKLGTGTDLPYIKAKEVNDKKIEKINGAKISTDTDLSRIKEKLKEDAGDILAKNAGLRSTGSGNSNYYPEKILANPFDYVSDGNLSVNMGNMDYIYTENDLHIDGVNGLDLDINRIFTSSFSNVTVPYGNATGAYANEYAFELKFDIYVSDNIDKNFTLVSNFNTYTLGEHYYQNGTPIRILGYSINDLVRQHFYFTANNYSNALAALNLIEYGDINNGQYGLLHLGHYTDNDLSNDAYYGSVLYGKDKYGDTVWIIPKPVIVPYGYFESAYKNYTMPYDYLMNEFGLGHGWRLGFSAIESYSYGAVGYHQRLILADGRVINLDGTELVNYPLSDIWLNDSGEGYSGAAYTLHYADGKREYFDANGRNIAIVDRFGNKITIAYTMQGNRVTKMEITDTLGNIVSFEESTIDLDGKKYITVPGLENVYRTNKVKVLKLNGEVINTYYSYTSNYSNNGRIEESTKLSAIKDANGEFTKISSNVSTVKFNCFTMSPTGNDEAIGKVNIYQSVQKNGLCLTLSTGAYFGVTLNNVKELMGSVGYDFYSDNDDDISYVGYIEKNALNRSVYHLTYTVKDFTLYTTGDYSHYYYIDNRYKSEEDKNRVIGAIAPDGGLYGSNTFTQVITRKFDNQGRINEMTDVVYDNSVDDEYTGSFGSPIGKAQVTSYVYYDPYSTFPYPDSVTTAICEPGISDSSMLQTYGYTYDNKGNTLSEILPNGERITRTYSSDYNIPLTTQYRKDANTTIIETNTLTADNKAVSRATKTENGNLVSKSEYSYDAKGRVLQARSYASDTEYTLREYQYGNSANPTRIITSDGTGSGQANSGIIPREYSFGVDESGNAGNSLSAAHGAKTITLPAGNYEVELWGAGGGSGASNAGGKGGYTRGEINLANASSITVHVGGKGTNGASGNADRSGGYNGGGMSTGSAGSGGGASDLYINGTKALIAGGGGGAGAGQNATGGNGGGTTGGSGYGSVTLEQSSKAANLNANISSGSGNGVVPVTISNQPGYSNNGGGATFGGDIRLFKSVGTLLYNRIDYPASTANNAKASDYPEITGSFGGGGGGGHQNGRSGALFGGGGGGGGSGYVNSAVVSNGSTGTSSHTGNGYVIIRSIANVDNYTCTVETATYNARGWLTSSTDANGKTTYYNYDPVGRVTSVAYPNGGTESYAYDVANRTVVYTNAEGCKQTNVYDVFGHLIEVYNDSDDLIASYGYDSMGCKVLETHYSQNSGKNQVTYWKYDNLLRLTETGYKDASGTKIPLESYTYRADLGKTTHTVYGSSGAPDSVETSYVDVMGNVIKTGVILNGTEYCDTYSYDFLGNCIEYKSAYTASKGGAYSERRSYDALGNVLSVTDTLGNVSRYTYDLQGKVLSATDAKGSVTSYAYDDFARLAQTTTPIDGNLNNVVKYTYDPVGNLTKQETSMGNGSAFSTTEYSYDAMGNVTRVSAGNGLYVETKSYDRLGRLVSDSTGRSYSYDRNGNLTSEKDPLGNREYYTYDLNGLVLTHTDRNGNVCTYTYDNRGRMTAQSVGGINRTYTYAKNGRLIGETKGGDSVSYTYDALGRLVSENECGVSKSYSYDIGGHTLSSSVGGVSTSYAYDTLGRLASVSGGGVSASYTYNAVGCPTLVSYGNGVKQSYTYNAANLITKITTAKGSSNLKQETYSYYADGNRSSYTSFAGNTVTTTYDALGRLTNEHSTGANAYDKTYTYDARGNRAKLIVAGGETVTYTYDANNRLISSADGKSYTYDANGNTLTERTNGTVSATYAYDAENKLISYTAGNVGYTYGYYPSGLRRTKTGRNVATNSVVSTNTYIWDGNNLVKDNSDAYRYGLSAISRNNTYYLHDAHGSVVGIANASGGIIKTYAYDAFGVELSPAASDANPFRYSGEYFDAESGDYYLRARYYAPGLGRFLTEDPVRDGDNWYVYCNNNPVRYVDPSGKSMVLTAAAVTYAVRLVTGAIITVLAAWLTSPEGQQALNNGAKVIHEAVKNVGEAIDNAGDSIANPSGGGTPAPQKPNNNGPTAIKIISKIATGAALKEAAEEIFKAGSGRSNNKIDFPDGDAQLKHIFRNAEGHLLDTPENRQKILDVASNADNYLGQDARGNDWYAIISKDGTQTWVRVRNGVIDNAGVNSVPRTWNSETGLYNNSKK